MGAFPIRIPKVSLAIHEATLLGHIVEEGGKVNEGDPLFRIETEKVETEVASPASGVVHWTAAVDETYPVGTQIGVIDTGD